MIKFNYLKYTFLTVTLAVIASVCLVPKSADALAVTPTYGANGITFGLINNDIADYHTIRLTSSALIDDGMEMTYGHPDFDVQTGSNYFNASTVMDPHSVGDNINIFIAYPTGDPTSDYYGLNLATDAPRINAEIKVYAHGGSLIDTQTIQIYGNPANVVNEIPTLSEWGMIAFFILLVGSAVWVMRRKQDGESI